MTRDEYIKAYGLSVLYRDDVVVLHSEDPVDRNDPESAQWAIEYSVPEGFSDKAQRAMAHLEGLLFEYKGQLVYTDEAVNLSVAGDGSMENPFGMPRAICDTWEELEAWAEDAYDFLKSEGYIE